MTTSNAAAFTFKSLLSLLLFMESRSPSAKIQVGLPCPDHTQMVWLVAHLPCQLSELRTLTTNW